MMLIIFRPQGGSGPLTSQSARRIVRNGRGGKSLKEQAERAVWNF